MGLNTAVFPYGNIRLDLGGRVDKCPLSNGATIQIYRGHDRDVFSEDHILSNVVLQDLHHETTSIHS
ncbi:hypothetical protein [Pseudodesulfovibrio sp.]|uniref:hypothetical protein n=1 Tax=unclassified Pseudodesulfovibrio TaxID=2661612 RepID=UPI003B000086